MRISPRYGIENNNDSVDGGNDSNGMGDDDDDKNRRGYRYGDGVFICLN